jgi:hypothetical protein
MMKETKRRDWAEKVAPELAAEIDDREPLEKLFDCLTAARLAYYRPAAHPSERRDIICLCCGNLYRPDDILNGENIFLCLSCIAERVGVNG